MSYLSDILVSHPADLLDIGGTLRHVLQRVTREDELILLGGGSLNIDTRLHDNSANELLADEVSDLNLVQVGLGVLGDVDVDGEMGVDVSHLVLEALGDTNDQVVDEGSYSSEGSDILADTVVNLDGDLVLLGDGEVDSQVAEILDQLAAGTLNGDNSRLNADLDYRENESAFPSCELEILVSTLVDNPLGNCQSLHCERSLLLVFLCSLHLRITLAIFRGDRYQIIRATARKSDLKMK